MADLREQRVCIKFCFKLGKTAAETHHMLKQAFGDSSLGQTQSYDTVADCTAVSRHEDMQQTIEEYLRIS
jgi:hypothetical protein